MGQNQTQNQIQINTNKNNNLIDETHQTIYFEIIYRKFENKEGYLELINTTDLYSKQCSIEDLSEHNKNLFEVLQNKTCIDYKDSQISFGGNFDSNYFNDFFYIMIKYCEEGQVNNEGIPCNPKNISDKMFNDYIYFNSYIQKINIDPSNYTNPLSYDLHYAYQAIDKFIVKDTYFYISEVQAITDNGWILENIRCQLKDMYKIL